MGKAVFVLLTIALVTSLMVGAPIACVTVPKSMEELGVEEFEEIALSFLEKVAVTPSSHVYVLGPVEPGTVVREEAPMNVTAVELVVPEVLGTNYVFVVDDMPDHLFAHPMRYVWMQYECGEIKVVNASRWPVISQPGVTPTPFVFIRSTVIGDISFAGLGGSGRTAVGTDISHKRVASPPNIPKGPGCCVGRNYSLVIDGGDCKCWPNEAVHLANNAELIAGWLIGKGFQVYRISQYWGKGHDYLPYSGQETPSGAFERIFKAYAANLTCCDNFFLYICAHGSKPPGDFLIYDATGNGRYQQIGYSDLRHWLAQFPPCVKVTIFIDSCKSGVAIEELKQLRDKDKGNLSKVTILTSTDKEKNAASGGGLSDSGTEDFLEAADKDLDGDGVKGDLGDCAKSMRDEWGAKNPQICKDPRHDTLCDLDGKKKGNVEWQQCCG